MSILSSLLQQLISPDNEEEVTERPCPNCPSHCAIAGQGACPECEPYKKKLIDQIYNVRHLDEFYDRYEVTGPTQISVSGKVTCPVCGAHSANPYICEYCDSRISDAPESSGKIQVEKASDIPNPIMDAQDIIFERFDAVIKKYTSSKESRSLLGDLFDALTGGDDDEDDSLGAKMSEAEIKEAAKLYKMDVADYLTGLDNGTCLTLKGKKAADQQAQTSSAASEPAAFGLPGIAGLGLLSSALIHQTEIQPHFYKPPTSGNLFTFTLGGPQTGGLHGAQGQKPPLQWGVKPGQNQGTPKPGQMSGTPKPGQNLWSQKPGQGLWGIRPGQNQGPSHAGQTQFNPGDYELPLHPSLRSQTRGGDKSGDRTPERSGPEPGDRHEHKE